MKLSVIVPVYNMADGDKLTWCLNSLVNQTISDYEIIAVDDCSTDCSLEILRDYEKKYPDKFKVIASPVNKKQGGAKIWGWKSPWENGLALLTAMTGLPLIFMRGSLHWQRKPEPIWWAVTII